MPNPLVKAPTSALVTVKASKADLGAWRERVSLAQKRTDDWLPRWKDNLARYAPDTTTNIRKYNETINTNRDFTLVERKKADLFYRCPDVTVSPSPLLVGQEALMQTHQTILNEVLSEDGVDALGLMDELLFDVLCPAGFMWSLLGYEATIEEVEQPAPAPADPLTGQPPMGPDGQPLQVMQTVPVPIYEDVFWVRLSPVQVLIPAEFRSTHYDRAPWLGYRFEMPLRAAKRIWTLPAEFKGDTGGKPITFQETDQSGHDPMARGVTLFYKSALYRDDIRHPLHITKLVLIEGVDDPVEHRDSPDQSFDAVGRLTPDSLIGFPIHGGTLRVLSDSAYVPSDCTISAPLVNELNKFRDQMVRNREASIPLRMFNSEVLPPADLQKIISAPIGGMIPVPQDAFQGEGAIKEIARAQYPRENFTTNDYVDNDIARTHAIDASQSGVESTGTVKTATELQLNQGNANARLDKERNRVIKSYYITGVTKLSTLIQRYYPQDKAAEIVGQAAAQAWAAWTKQVPTRLALTVTPDSSLRTDTASERNMDLQFYQMTANDPNAVRVEILKSLATKFHKDPAKVVNEQPPQPPPKPPDVSIAIKGDDLNPQMPQYANIAAILKEKGIDLVPAQPAPAPEPGGLPQMDHPGAVSPQEPLSKHQMDQTGNMQGTGQPAPMAPGGGL